MNTNIIGSAEPIYTPDGKFYFIYETKNLINGKIYVGKHTTKTIEDGYLGSGIYLNRAIEKYGKQNFERKILFFTNCEEENRILETQIVSKEFVKRRDTYNIAIGGAGGNVIEGHSTERKQEIARSNSIRVKTIWDNRTEEERLKILNKIRSKTDYTKISESTKKYWKELYENKTEEELDVIHLKHSNQIKNAKKVECFKCKAIFSSIVIDRHINTCGKRVRDIYQKDYVNFTKRDIFILTSPVGLIYCTMRLGALCRKLKISEYIIRKTLTNSNISDLNRKLYNGWSLQIIKQPLVLEEPVFSLVL